MRNVTISCIVLENCRETRRERQRDRALSNVNIYPPPEGEGPLKVLPYLKVWEGQKNLNNHGRLSGFHLSKPFPSYAYE